MESMSGKMIVGFNGTDNTVETARQRGAAVVTPTLVEGGPVTALLGTARDGDTRFLGSRARA